MKELTKEFGGSAEAAGNQGTFSGNLEAQEPAEQRQKLKEAGRILGDVAEQMKKVYDQVANYLSPKLEALWNSVNEKLIPALSDFWHNILEPMVPVIGTILVGAIGAAVDILKILVDVMAPVFQFMADHKTTVEILAGAFALLEAGFASGGYTGAGAADEVAGIVHKGEYVVPKSQVDQNRGVPMMPGNGGVTNVVVNIGLYTGSEQEKRKVAMEIFKSLQDIAGSKSMTVSQMLGA
jgi:hypothetical protein